MTELVYIPFIVLLAIWEGLEFKGKKTLAKIVKYIWLIYLPYMIIISKGNYWHIFLFAFLFYASLFTPIWNITTKVGINYIGVTEPIDMLLRKLRVPGFFVNWIRLVIFIATIFYLIYN